MSKITSVSPYFGKPPVVRSPFCLSVIRVLHFNSVHLKTVTQAEQEGKLFGRLASVLLVLCACQCACLVALAIRDFAYCPPHYLVRRPMQVVSPISFSIFPNPSFLLFAGQETFGCGRDELGDRVHE